jgi:hypothetical protein
MHGFDAKIAFDFLDKSQAANCEGFRLPIVSHRRLALKRFLYPLTVCSLKISQIRKAAQRLNAS